MLTLHEAERRRSLHYCRLLESLDGEFDSSAKRPQSITQRFADESTNIVEAWAWAAANFRTDGAATELAERYAAAGARIMAGHVPPDLSIRWCGIGVRAARSLGNSRTREALHVIRLAKAYTLVGDTIQASRTLDEAARLVTQHGLGEHRLQVLLAEAFADILLLDEEWERAAMNARRGLASLAGNDTRLRYSLSCQLAEGLCGMGAVDDGAEWYRRSAALGLAIGDPGLEARACAGMALAQIRLGATWRGRLGVLRAKRLKGWADDVHSAAVVAYLGGLASLALARPGRATRCFHEVLQLAGYTGWWRIGDVAMRELQRLQGVTEEVLTMTVARDSLELARKAGDRRSEAHKLAELGDWWFYDREKNEARTFYVMALRLAQELHDADLVARLTASVTSILMNLRKFQAVVDLGVAQMPNLAVATDRRYVIEVGRRIGDAYHAMGRIGEARQQYHEVLAAVERVGDQTARDEITRSLASL